MKIQTLENIDIIELVDTFNLSFSDYIIPIKFTKNSLENKIISESIDLNLSIGAFEDNKLIGLILHGFDVIEGKKVVYKAGTGIIPEKRGNRITSLFYDFIIPKFREKNIEKIQLEVITTNTKAINTYKKIGFEIKRELDSYKGKISTNNTKSKFIIKKLEYYDWEILKSFWDWIPSWQNSITSIKKLENNVISLGIYDNNLLAGYIVYNPTTNRINQFAINKKNRNLGLGKSLFQHISKNNDNIFYVNNIHSNSINSKNFLLSLGLEFFIKQYEMELRI